jgi:hypothetical protein
MFLFADEHTGALVALVGVADTVDLLYYKG